MLLSGSQDGTVKCFDLRSKDVKLTFNRFIELIKIKFILWKKYMFVLDTTF
jgi:hypothetical protein